MKPFALGLCLFLAVSPAAAQTAPPQIPGQPEPSRVVAATYTVDPGHTQVAFAVNHLGFNVYHGLIGGSTGTLTLDPARPESASVAIEIPLAEVVTTSPELTDHLKTADFFDVANHPTATFRSTSVTVDGTRARIAGDLTLRGVTRPVELDARFVGAGMNPMHKTLTAGFEATTSIRRSAFGIAFALPAVADQVDLAITVAFEKPE
ncbi:YceI family protein [Azospirillum sp. ST 5-10]|uniref:YceI family protein n=1 Tax=unclassified Azospirillum TaxID=2630922 RepID=UPI003F4A2B64